MESNSRSIEDNQKSLTQERPSPDAPPVRTEFVDEQPSSPGEERKPNVTFMPAVAGSRKILIVDDEGKVTETLGLIFSTRGYEVRVACSAEQAIETLAEWKPDLAIVDVMLPQMNGIEFGIALKSNYPECHLLLFSGHPDTGALLDGAREQGHNFDILAKPLKPSYILSAVYNLLPAGNRPAEA
jgi:DNA-binding NtrC family response regulator